MRALVLRLSEGYRSYHDTNQSLLEWIGLVGAIAFPLLYALRFTGKMPPLYDDFALRAVATSSCILLALRRWWPERWRRCYHPFSYGTVLYCLAFMLPLTLLHNQATAPSAVNMVVSVVLIVLLTDWRNTLVMLAFGYALSFMAYWFTATDPRWPVDFLLWWFPVCGVLVAGGGIGKHVEKRAELERLRRVYAGLAGSIAHEVRTPLAQIQHAINQAVARLPPTSDAAQLLMQGQRAVRRGLQAVSITLQQINGRPLNASEFIPLSAARCVSETLNSYAHESAESRERVRLQVDEDFCFLGDQTAFELVLFNLLKNALYYLPVHPGLEVRVRIGRQPQPCVVVRDTGPGIAPSLLLHLFGEFETLGKANGTGLGLAFCRRVMSEFGGTIECRSELGSFTEFTLSFPALKATHATRPQPPEATSCVLSGRTMLVVDDQALNRSVAEALLREKGAKVLQAEHGEQALDLLRGGCLPDAILMDVNMPGLDGLATTRCLRTLAGAAGRVPVLAVTANDSPAQEAAAREAGMQAMLGKPLDPLALEREFKKVLGDEALFPTNRSPALLNTQRLADFRRLGLIDELLPEGLARIRCHLDTLRAAIARNDGTAELQALHSLLGLTGEVGAQALQARVRHHYELRLKHQAIGATLADVTVLENLLLATERALTEG